MEPRRPNRPDARGGAPPHALMPAPAAAVSVGQLSMRRLLILARHAVWQPASLAAQAGAARRQTACCRQLECTGRQSRSSCRPADAACRLQAAMQGNSPSALHWEAGCDVLAGEGRVSVSARCIAMLAAQRSGGGPQQVQRAWRASATPAAPPGVSASVARCPGGATGDLSPLVRAHPAPWGPHRLQHRLQTAQGARARPCLAARPPGGAAVVRRLAAVVRRSPSAARRS